MQFERVTVFYNEQKPQNKPLAEQVAAWLTDHERTTAVITSLDDLADTSLLVCMGGDGALLACAREAARIVSLFWALTAAHSGFWPRAKKTNLNPRFAIYLTTNSFCNAA